VAPSDLKRFDLVVDGRYAELKAKNKPYKALDFFWLSESQYRAAQEGPDYTLFLVCGCAEGCEPEVFEIPSSRLREVKPKSEIHYFYDKGLVDKLLSSGNA